MIPKKIYLNYVDEDDLDKTWSEEPISVCDCDMQNREYTDLSQVWHDASEEPNKYEFILVRYVSCQNELKYFAHYVTNNAYGMLKEFEHYGKCRWAYISDLLPKGGEK